MPRFGHHSSITSSDGAAASIFNSQWDIPAVGVKLTFDRYLNSVLRYHKVAFLKIGSIHLAIVIGIVPSEDNVNRNTEYGSFWSKVNAKNGMSLTGV